ncbi:Alpha-1,2-mannosyltransferase alg9; AltName: Full=Asparagine-linked glycosylation protein 9; AltName: Full=Dol-P-Man:Man(6)GlcNAc(2)-PP-Dol alpha-1,2-mannosyltransferase; AltName: Full=Dol-P-Man:Man(8)GlcNAc(2)-PP-Dol alpha-1,2-mannosyltransferase; Flags: Precursor [Serendipita indica DSM 11827]|uniref:Mannosyltransferase n=1 Tax=Serendipita indica (strain DSM 11827) TaxID=1109443 RepID=G4T8Y1_SERID|nr:Alpha-1,2-mannosyltransferase alg9; AltName: Full=Asparagine-linked glycosylation protein 9; AltName: Full=Dol-P-Man:Man(6)GlcNAc(2)-PP-Dol alpha-1,2-mannosyltransferase; AltName: Full=Dol-P-Man:Man(8)GlcNAc(2)-PP-Dol alpha-1,2-mannosyltransferase; Flags: Precursor [Serendipita indica DSM 11827]CCA67749.1 related to ALG9-mannosyltransferase [Serendipita indica DSM 11827]
MSTIPGTQQLRFRKPSRPSSARSATLPSPKPAGSTESLLREKTTAYKPTSKGVSWCPSFLTAVRILLLVRFCSAMFSNISDCDEVFNFWEPLHYLQRGYGFQTWEVSPQFAIRSWAYIFLHYPFATIGTFLSNGKGVSFFAVRGVLSLISTLCEAKLFRSIVENVNERVGIYFFFMLLTSTGMWSASTAFLPSTFAMYCNMVAFSFALSPAKSKRPGSTDIRTMSATLLFGAGAIVGWPFSILVSLPFVFEELFVYSGDVVPDSLAGSWIVERWIRMVGSVTLTSLLFLPVIGIDSLAYGKFVVVPWNIIRYNIFGGSERGPDLYGTEPWYFYLFNLALNFNVLLPLALLSVPALIVTHRVDYSRLGIKKHTDHESSPYTLLVIRLAPFYLWFGVLTAQAHKEERFMFPIYPFLCFNAAVTLYLVRGWLEALYIKMTSQYQASRTSTMRLFTMNVIIATTVISSLRIIALYAYYHAPMTMVYQLEHVELPRLLNATNLLPPLPPTRNKKYDNDVSVDLSLIKEFDLRLCIGKEWYRFPSHFLVPDGIEVRFMKTAFDGLLPQPFPPSKGDSVWAWDGTRESSPGLNDLNMENPTFYVDPSTCDYIIDLDFPSREYQSRDSWFTYDKANWEKVHCRQFLDAENSPALSRILWLPGKRWWNMNMYGDYCLLRNQERASTREGGGSTLY